MRRVLIGALSFLIAIVVISPPVAEAIVTSNYNLTSSGTILMSGRPLHVDGKYIKDNLGNVVILKGVNKMTPNEAAIGIWGYHPELLSQELDLLKSYGVNVIRIHGTYEWWIQNTVFNGVPFRTILHDYISLCAQKGIYVVYDGYCVVYYGEQGYEQDPLPWENCHAGIIDTPQDWINFWVSFVNAMKDLPNVIIDPHNEPLDAFPPNSPSKPNQIIPNAENTWFSALQQMINAVRQAGFTGLILEQWSSNTWWDFNNPYATDSNSLSWVTNHPLTDPLNNLVISTHHYRQSGSLGAWGQTHAYQYNDIIAAFNTTLIFHVLNDLHKPILIGECGCSMDTGDLANEETAWTNQLAIYNQLKISYLCWWWRNVLSFRLFTNDTNPLGTLTQGGVILKNALLAS